ncbi:Scr1 family TA system antitoxin-like transcriptional regulator [Allosalinactinospora lopnorensis]|uniref:Scr1 family TA system antitoxin-like transcriptional regulator n=1 Tax=Allosalinactinospora lopnorensis TaxID=1352348 RepID=UPI000AA62013
MPGRCSGDGDSQSIRRAACHQEAALRRRVGGPEVMAGQLRHLLAMGERETVSIRAIANCRRH